MAMGRLNHINNVRLVTYTKITYDDEGHTIVGEQR